MEEFVYPDFIKNNDPDMIHKRMLQRLPPDISTMPGDFAYDFTYPSALEKSELIQFHIVRTLMMMFPQYAWGEYLDLHGQQVNITRKPAGYAYGKLEITGIPGTRIEKGKRFCTAATDSSSSVEFATVGTVQIPTEGKVTVEVMAVESGTASNVAAGTVVLAMKPIEGITGICNLEAITGGSQEENDEAFWERIKDLYQKGVSFVGNDADYIRWAKEVVGVGAASVIPEWNGPGTVKIILIDSNGQPANEHICQAVYEYIMQPNDRLLRKAPIGAILTVSPPDIVAVSYSATVELLDGYSLETVKTEFTKNLLKYYDAALGEGEIKHTKVGAVLSGTVGVNDYTELLVNGSEGNVPIHTYEFPSTVSVTLKSGVVE